MNGLDGYGDKGKIVCKYKGDSDPVIRRWKNGCFN